MPRIVTRDKHDWINVIVKIFVNTGDIYCSVFDTSGNTLQLYTAWMASSIIHFVSSSSNFETKYLIDNYDLIN